MILIMFCIYRRDRLHIASKRNVKLSAFFDVSCSPTEFSNYTRCGAPNFPVVMHFKFQMHIKWLLLY
jgi:hypothetical protein